jgi:hypothetical protein
MKRDEYRARAVKLMREAEFIAEPDRQLAMLTYAQCWLRLAANTEETISYGLGNVPDAAPGDDR